MTPVRLEPAAPRSRVKHSSTETLRSLNPFECVAFRSPYEMPIISEPGP